MSHPSDGVSKDNVFKVFQIADHMREITKEDAINLAIVATQAKNLVVAILNCVPDCADRSASIRAVREAEMWARTAIELEPGDEQ